MNDMGTPKNAGFSLIEIIMVLVVLSIVSVVLATRLMDTSVELVAATDVIKTHLRYAQARAMGDNSVWGVSCDGVEYWLYNDGNIANRITLPGEDDDAIKITDDPRWQNIDTVEAFTLSFDDRGIPYTDALATVKLTSGHAYSQITVSSGGNSKIITITPNTGFIP